ncbi:hypothetical protein HAX54_034212 [Datura stramonium]|uniref:Uncharacterized protein n=1 Tax=Datura stramonium TaxID=4076 RepID=A0ABS8VDS3_DATST|nr:hypothetical protein [Datura stramonium]
MSHKYNDVTNKQEATRGCCMKGNSKRRQLRDESKSESSSGSEFDEGSHEAESDGDNPPSDNVGKGNDDDAQSGEGDTNVEESSDKDSNAEESNEQEENSGIIPEARSKRWFLQGSRDVYYAGLHLTEKGNPIRSI